MWGHQSTTGLISQRPLGCCSFQNILTNPIISHINTLLLPYFISYYSSAFTINRFHKHDAEVYAPQRLVIYLVYTAHLVLLVIQIASCYLFSIYTLGSLGDSSNLIGSLSRTMTLYSPCQAVNIKQNTIAVVNWVFSQSLRVRTEFQSKNFLKIQNKVGASDFELNKGQPFSGCIHAYVQNFILTQAVNMAARSHAQSSSIALKISLLLFLVLFIEQHTNQWKKHCANSKQVRNNLFISVDLDISEQQEGHLSIT